MINPLLLLLSLVFAVEDQPSKLTLDRLFRPGEFRVKDFGHARWTDDGAGYTTRESSDLVFHATEDGSRKILVPATELTPPGEDKPLHIDDYAWSKDGKKLLIFTNTRKVWRTNTRGDYWVLDLDSSKLHKLGGDADPSTLMFAKFSPDATRAAYVCRSNIYVEALSDGAITPLTEGGTETLINGTFDWVYEEEFGLRDGFRWSPDGKRIAYWQIDAQAIRKFHLINNTDELYPRLIPVRYPKAGTENAVCRVGVVSAEGGETRWMEVPGDASDHYIARMDWAASSEEIVLQQLNRLQQENKVILASAATGEVRTILTENDDAWLDVGDDLRWFDDGAWFSWISERDGWKHLYLVSRSGEEANCLTPGDFDVISVEHIDDVGGWVYYIASPENPTQRFLYRSPINGKSGSERLTPAGALGTHSYRISPDSRWAFHSFSSFGRPPATALVSLPAHETVRVLETNAEVRKKVARLSRGKSGFFRIDIGVGAELDAWYIMPPEFDEKKRYPLLFYVYGEPAGQTVLDRWGGRYYLWHLMLAQQGYVIMSVDNRGTPAPRGRAFRKCIYRKVGLLPSEEQAAAAKAVMKLNPWVDPERIGIWGWSGGGSMSLNMVFRHPEIYSTAMAVATVPDQRLYDTIYIERYMGLPQENPEDYDNGSPITFAHRLEGNLLIVHGTGDDNCHYQGVERLVNKLIAHDRRFTMMAYPNRRHGIYEGKNTSRHLFGLLTAFLTENLPPGPR